MPYTDSPHESLQLRSTSRRIPSGQLPRLLFAACAFLLGGCGSSVEQTDEANVSECTARVASDDVEQNCVAYCSAFDCVECSDVVATCEASCRAHMAHNTDDDCETQLIRCATEHVHEVVHAGGLYC